MQTIQDHKQYHLDMHDYLEDLEYYGPSVMKPKKPKNNLSETTKTKERLYGDQLHAYLKDNCKTIDDKVIPQIPVASSLENVKECLVKGKQVLNNLRSKTMAACIDYGSQLNLAFAMYETAVKDAAKEGRRMVPFKQWIVANVGISDGYARKLRRVSEILGQYRRFRKLGLPFSEVYSRVRDIENLLLSNPVAKQYWSTNN